MSFYDTIGDIGQALSGIPQGLNAGLTPFGTWENIRTKDLANDRTDLQLQDLAAIQAARDAASGYYGDLVGAAQSGYQNTIAKNQFGTDTYQQQLALAQYMRSPEGQALLAGQTPGSYGYDAGLLQGASQFLPMQVPDMFKSYGMNALDQQVAGQQVGENMLRYQLQQMNPGSQIDVVRMPGQGYVALVDGQPMDIPASLLRGAFGAEGISGPQNAIDAQIKLQQAIQTGDMNLITQALKATEGFQNDPMVAQLNKVLAENRLELNSLVAQRAKIDSTFFPDPQEKVSAIAANEARITQLRQNMEALQQQIVTRASRARGVGGGLFTPTISGPTTGSNAISFGPNGVPQTQVISDFRRPVLDIAPDTSSAVPSRFASGQIRFNPFNWFGGR